MDITQKTITELKALAYDALSIIEQYQKNLQVINEEISKRMKEEATKQSKNK